MHAFLISNTFICNARLKLAKKKQANVKQHPKVKLSFAIWKLKISHILHPRYHPKIIGRILKINKITSLYSWDYTINHNENKDENEK